MQIRHRIHEVVVEDQPRGATVLQDELQLVGHQPPIQRHDHGADLGQCEVGLDELGAVHQEQRHTFALRDASCQERIGGSVAAVVQRIESEPLAVVAYICLTLRR